MWEWVKSTYGVAERKLVGFLNWVSAPFLEKPIRLASFREVLAVEHDAINRRRNKHGGIGTAITKLAPADKKLDGHARRPSPDLPKPTPQAPLEVDVNKSDPGLMPLQLVPCTAVGVALSGGGIRSAAFCLGALQALDFRGVIKRTDYLSTVSGGGYIGACLTAGMSKNGGKFPLGGASDIRDNFAIGHIRNYSNYLMPRAHSALRNVFEVVSILLRGLLANALIVLTFLLAAAFFTFIAYPHWNDLPKGNFVLQFATAVPDAIAHFYHSICPAFLDEVLTPPLSQLWSIIGTTFSVTGGFISTSFWKLFGILLSPLEPRLSNLILSDCHAAIDRFSSWFFEFPFSVTTLLAALLAVMLIDWARRRSRPEDAGDDVNSPTLRKASSVLGLTILSAILDLQPFSVYGLGIAYTKHLSIQYFLSTPLITGAVAVALFARKLAAFLETTQLSQGIMVRLLRIGTKASMIIAGLVLPFVLLVIYWHFAAWLIDGGNVWRPLTVHAVRWLSFWTLIVLGWIMWSFEANAYSLHQFYKDRLSKAFLFDPQSSGALGPDPLSPFKLSEIKTEDCPYHIINAALNVQASKIANGRGRNADFFTFTRDFVGSDVTYFAVTTSSVATTTTRDMETVDPKLDLGSAMAVSGAALSANMGSNTVRWLSPTLALLNIRLGYWLRNPRNLARRGEFLRLIEWFNNFFGKFYLLLEMFNFLDENRKFVYLSDGGHVENLGIYQLLKRGCRLIIAIDSEADPEVSCSSLLKLERYARIDLGIRIILPWEQIRARNREVNKLIDPATPGEPKRKRGEHCALGPILYQDGSRGMLLYFKSSLSGDEKDYVLAYKKRFRDFPHETTGDQFFTEEQFEVYRTLGYHVVDGYFSNSDRISWQRGRHGWRNLAAAKKDVRQALGWN
jgi:hypothetical protein